MKRNTKRKALCKIGAFTLALTLLAGSIPGQLTAAGENGIKRRNGRVVWLLDEPEGLDSGYYNTRVDGKEYDLGEDNSINWNYDETNQTLTISGRGWTGSDYFTGHEPDDWDKWEADLPDTSWFKYERKAKHIVIEEGITAIGTYQFSPSFGQVETIEIPDSVEWISMDTFRSSYPAEDGKRYPIIYGMPCSFAELYAYAFGYSFVPKEPKALLGDLNGKNGLDPDDALSVLQMIVGKIDSYGYSGDADGDGQLTVDDALYILKKVAGK